MAARATPWSAKALTREVQAPPGLWGAPPPGRVCMCCLASRKLVAAWRLAVRRRLKGGESWNTIDRAGRGPILRSVCPFQARALAVPLAL